MIQESGIHVNKRCNNDRLEAFRRENHSRCVVCGQPRPGGLGLAFHAEPDGSVTARFDAAGRFEGYDGMVHGGVISALADGAMTHCLFAHGIAAVTAELNVRFRHPMNADEPVEIVARITRDARPLFTLQADLAQNGRVKARATAKFMETEDRP